MKKIIIPLAGALLLFTACKKSTLDIKQAPSQTAVTAHTPATPEPLTARFTYTVPDPINIFENQDIKFQNLSTGFATCVWEFGNTTKTQAMNPTMSYPWHGYYTVKLTVFDANGNRNSITQDISILCLYAGGIHPPTTGGR